jgi:predicted ferric reductase
MNSSVLWYATRGAGVVSLLLLTAVAVLGITSALGWQTRGWPKFVSSGLHRNLALLSIVFLFLHVVAAVVDPFTALGWTAALIPFSSPYRRFWLGLGVVAIDLGAAVVATSLLRQVVGVRAWRLVHWLAYACWPIAVLHGIGTGSDARFTWMLGLNAACIAAVGLAVGWRVRSRFRKVASPMLAMEVINQ